MTLVSRLWARLVEWREWRRVQDAPDLLDRWRAVWRQP